MATLTETPSETLTLVHPKAAEFLAAPGTQLLIAGKWLPAASGETFPVENPATGGIIGRAAAGDRRDVDAAVAAARAALANPAWAKMSPHARGRLLLRI